jgi:hypothetical protein
VFENGVPRRISGPERDEIVGDWSKLLKEEPYSLYYSPNIIRIIKSMRTRQM